MPRRERPAVGARGLDALQGSGTLTGISASATTVTDISLGAIRTCLNPRRHSDPNDLAELAASIADKGVVQPVLVRPAGEAGRYQLIAGERRVRAAALAGLTSVPAIIRDLDERDARLFALLENVQRVDLNPIDRADATVERIAEALSLPREQVPARLRQLRRKGRDNENDTERVRHTEALEAVFRVVGGSWTTFAVHLLPLLNYPPDVLDAVRTGQLEYTKAAVLARVKDEDQRAKLLAPALQGASLEELKQRAASRPHATSAREERVRRVRSALGSWRRVERLPARKQNTFERLLEQLEVLLNEAD